MTAAETVAADPTFAVPAGDDRIRRAADALAGRNYATHVVDTAADARALVRSLLPRDKSIFTALGVTLLSSGIAEDIDSSDEFRSVRRQLAGMDGDIEAQIRLGAAPDVVVGSVHAVTEDGIMLVASASGSQLSSYAAGARRAIWVVGAQKVVPDFDTALRRLHTYSLPMERERMRPQGFDSFIGKILILEREFLPGRGTVVLVRDAIGY